MSTSRLRMGTADARDRLTDLINEGWILHGELDADYRKNWAAGTWDKADDRVALCRRIDDWYANVKKAFDATFATAAEWAKLEAASGPAQFVCPSTEDCEATQKLRALMVKVGALEGIRDSLGTGHGTVRATCAGRGYFSVTDLAQRHNVDKKALDQRLRRWRKRRAAGSEYIEQDLGARGEPKFLYQGEAVLSIVEKLRGVGNS